MHDGHNLRRNLIHLYGELGRVRARAIGEFVGARKRVRSMVSPFETYVFDIHVISKRGSKSNCNAISLSG